MKNSKNELTCDEEQDQRFVGHKCHFRYNLDQVNLAETRSTYRKAGEYFGERLFKVRGVDFFRIFELACKFNMLMTNKSHNLSPNITGCLIKSRVIANSRFC